MKYYRNTDLAKLYKVSEKSVRNWIDAAIKGKLDLQLHEQGGKHYIANTTKNTLFVEALVEKGKKYKNTRGFKTVTPTNEFYETYNDTQILDIISNLTIHREIPIKYSYADGGALLWNEYANRLLREQTPNILTTTIELLSTAEPVIERLVDSNRKINVIDLGPGNGLPVRDTLEYLIAQGRLNRYIAIDSSAEMLQICEKNIKTWFGDTAHYEGYVRDFSFERFDDLFVNDQAQDEANIPANVVLLLGGTLNNLRNPNHALRTINNSLGINDLLIWSGYLDTPSTRRYFDFNPSGSGQKLRTEIILSHLGIDQSLYEIRQEYDPERHGRFGSFVPKVDLSIQLKLGNSLRSVELRKNEEFLLFRHWHCDGLDIIKQLDHCDFDMMQTTKSPDSQYMLLVAKTKVGTK